MQKRNHQSRQVPLDSLQHGSAPRGRADVFERPRCCLAGLLGLRGPVKMREGSLVIARARSTASCEAGLSSKTSVRRIEPWPACRSVGRGCHSPPCVRSESAKGAMSCADGTRRRRRSAHSPRPCSICGAWTACQSTRAGSRPSTARWRWCTRCGARWRTLQRHAAFVNARVGGVHSRAQQCGLRTGSRGVARRRLTSGSGKSGRKVMWLCMRSEPLVL